MAGRRANKTGSLFIIYNTELGSIAAQLPSCLLAWLWAGQTIAVQSRADSNYCADRQENHRSGPGDEDALVPTRQTEGIHLRFQEPGHGRLSENRRK